MSKEAERVLLLSGPQHYDERRPVVGNLKRVLEHTDPLGIAIVSAYLRKHGLETVYQEMKPGEENDLEAAIENAAGVFVSSRHYDTDLARNAINIANSQKKPSVVGGYGPTFVPEEFEDATARVLGEAEGVLDEIAADFLSGKLKPEYDARLLPPPDIHNNYTWPDRTIFPEWKGPFKGFKKHSQEWQRGCSNYCAFCSPTRLQKAQIQDHERLSRTRDPKDIIAEIESMGLNAGNHVFSVDLNTSSIPREEQIELFSYLKEKGLRWYTEGTVSQLLADVDENGEDKSILNLMSAKDGKGGCYSFLYGADDLVATRVKGSTDKEIKTLEAGVEIFRKFGVPLNLSVVIGLEDHQYPQSFFHIARVLEDVASPYAFIHIATPYKGTPWGDRLYKEGRVFDRNTIHHNHRRVVFEPENMSAAELEQGYYWLLRRLNSPQNIAEIVRRNTDVGTLQNNPMLGMIQTGLPWSIETMLSIKEMELRGYVDGNVQRILDGEYRNWKNSS